MRKLFEELKKLTSEPDRPERMESQKQGKVTEDEDKTAYKGIKLVLFFRRELPPEYANEAAAYEDGILDSVMGASWPEGRLSKKEIYDRDFKWDETQIVATIKFNKSIYLTPEKKEELEEEIIENLHIMLDHPIPITNAWISWIK
jgi:hypothetical protein